MTRKVADCRKFPSEMGCTLTISGQEEEVATGRHGTRRLRPRPHGQRGTPRQIHSMLEDEKVSA